MAEEKVSAEVEVLDQLVGGDMSLITVRQLFPSDPTFLAGIEGLLNAGEVQLMTLERQIVPQWQQRSLFREKGVLAQMTQFRLIITSAGAKRIR